MNGSVWSNAIVPIFVALVAVTPGMIMAWLAWRSSLRNNEKLQELTITVDGRLTQLLKLTAEAEHARGKIEQAASADPTRIEPKSPA